VAVAVVVAAAPVLVLVLVQWRALVVVLLARARVAHPALWTSAAMAAPSTLRVAVRQREWAEQQMEQTVQILRRCAIQQRPGLCLQHR
jgi:hypothetical protein